MLPNFRLLDRRMLSDTIVMKRQELYQMFQEQPHSIRVYQVSGPSLTIVADLLQAPVHRTLVEVFQVIRSYLQTCFSSTLAADWYRVIPPEENLALCFTSKRLPF